MSDESNENAPRGRGLRHWVEELRRLRRPAQDPEFEALAALEPRLEVLRREAVAWRDQAREGFCRNAVLHGYPGHQPGLRQRLSGLVGPQREGGGVLGTAEAYRTAYLEIDRSLPGCRHDGKCREFNKLARGGHASGQGDQPRVVSGSETRGS